MAINKAKAYGKGASGYECVYQFQESEPSRAMAVQLAGGGCASEPAGGFTWKPRRTFPEISEPVASSIEANGQFGDLMCP